MIFPIESFSISKYDCTEYVELKAHPDFPFKNGDRVRYKDYNLEEDPIVQHSILAYYPPLAAFVLVNYTDGSYNELLSGQDGNARVDLLAEIGIELLEKI
jgi:hypothetical protein